MKKFLTLVLALALALAMTVPAMAFTTTTPDEDVPYELDIYLVEYDDNDFFGIATLPATDRGYAKNEVVAAIVEVFVPEDEAFDEDYSNLVLSGDNVSLDVTDNDFNSAGDEATLRSTDKRAGSNNETVFDFEDDELSLDLDTTAAGFMLDDGKDVTSKFLFFAKVTGDEASLTATLDDATDDRFEDATEADIVIELDDVDYTVALDKEDKTYTVSEGAEELFQIVYGDKNKSKDLFIQGYLVGVSSDRETLTFTDGTTTLTSGTTYKALLKVYNDVFVDVFGFDFFARGGVVNNDTFYDLSGNENIEATVEIKPWTAYVTVPDNIVVDPPKTGDAASIVGFVMIVLAAAAVVAVKKVRA